MKILNLLQISNSTCYREEPWRLIPKSIQKSFDRKRHIFLFIYLFWLPQHLELKQMLLSTDHFVLNRVGQESRVIFVSSVPRRVLESGMRVILLAVHLEYLHGAPSRFSEEVVAVERVIRANSTQSKQRQRMVEGDVEQPVGIELLRIIHERTGVDHFWVGCDVSSHR